MELGVNFGELYSASVITGNVNDFIALTKKDKDTMKFTSLVSALMYVENPDNVEVVNKLREDIRFNRNGRK